MVSCKTLGIAALGWLFLAPSLSAQSVHFTRLDGTQVATDTLVQQLEELMRAHSIPGLSVAVLRGGEPVFVHNLGWACEAQSPVTDQTIFRAASITKPLFASLVLARHLSGSFDLDTPLHQYLPAAIDSYPDYADLADDARWKSLTPRQALSHTTGLPNWRWIFDGDTLRFHHAPGSRFEYSGEGFQLAQLAFEHAVGDSLGTYAAATLFEPLRMAHTGLKWRTEWAQDATCAHLANGEVYPHGRFKRAWAAGSASTHAHDLASWLTALLNDTPPLQGVLGKLMEPQIAITSRSMFGPQRLVEGPEHARYQLAWGLGWGLFTSNYGTVGFQTGHDEGVQNLLLVLPEQLTALVLLTTSDNFESNAQAFIEACIGPLDVPYSWLYGIK